MQTRQNQMQKTMASIDVTLPQESLPAEEEAEESATTLSLPNASEEIAAHEVQTPTS